MKTLVNSIKSALDTATWSAEYCHPHKWSTEDMDNCLNILSRSRISYATVERLTDEMFSEILTEYCERGNDTDFAQLAAEYIADRLAFGILKERKNAYFPESATFSII